MLLLTLLVERISEMDIFAGCVMVLFGKIGDEVAWGVDRSGAVKRRANVGLNEVLLFVCLVGV